MVDGAFVVDKWWDRYYNSHTYDKLVVPTHFAPSLISRNMEEGQHINASGDIEVTDLSDESEDGNNTGMLDPEEESNEEEEDVALDQLGPPESIEL